MLTTMVVDGNYIPATICLCHAKEPSECVCACISLNFEDYNYE